MAQITITIPDEHLSRVVEAVIYTLAPDAEAIDITPQNAKAVLISFLKNIVRTYDRDMARATMEASLPSSPDIT